MLIKLSSRKLLFFLLGIFLGLVSFGQTNYLQGFIIKNNGDTLFGLIDYHNWENNPKKIAFKDVLKKVTVYSANDIKKFHVSDEIYESAIIQIEISSRTLNTLDKNSDFQFVTDTGFVQTIIKGARSLYYYKPPGYEPNFYILQNGKLELLLYKKYLVETRGLSEKQNLKFIQQLKIYLSDCPTSFKQLDSLDYKKRSLEKTFINYYKCTQSTAVFHKKTEKIITEFGITAGLMATKIKFTGDQFYDRLINVNHQPSCTISGGLFAEFIFPRSQKKWSIYNELGYVSYKSNWKYGEITDPDYYTLYQCELKYSYIRLTNMLKFKYPVGNAYVFVKLGLSNGFVAAEKNYQQKEIKFYATPVITEGKLLADKRVFEQGFVSAVGSQLRKIFMEARFEVSNGISTYPNLGSPVKRISVQLGYKF